MATIRKLRGKYQAIVRRKGFPSASKSFALKSDARRWAIMTEGEMQRGVGVTRNERQSLANTLLRDLLHRYGKEVSPVKRGGDIEAIVLNAMARRSIGGYSLANLSPAHLARYRDSRLTEVKPATVHKELSLIQHCLRVAQRSWGYSLKENPAKLVDKPSLPQGRNRRLKEGEFDLLIRAARRARHKHLEPMIRLALATGMRRGELLSLKWEYINLSSRTAFLPVTKNGSARYVPLSSEALEVVSRLPRLDERLFPTTVEAFKQAWARTRTRAGLFDLRFHDLRHEATSRFFELGLSVPEVALITGHKDARMLFRYTHLRAETIARKLAS